MQLSKKDNLGLFLVILFFWAFPTIESINRDAKSAQELSTVGELMLYLGVAVFLFAIHPLFLAMWNWIKKWTNGEKL